MPPPLPLPPEETPLPVPRPKPEPEPKPPKPQPEPPKPKPAVGPLPERNGVGDAGAGAGSVTTAPPDLLCHDTCSGPCAYLPHCHPPPAPSGGATLHLRSSRLPTPLIAVSASLLAVSAVLLLALLVHRLVARRRRRRRNAALAALQGVEGGGGHGHQVLAGAVAAQELVGEEDDADDGVHHVWYIRTKGLDERAIAAIAAVVYDAKKRGALGLGGGGGGGADGGDGDYGDDDGSCAVCLAEFRDGETLRLLPRCGHAFHRGCIDTWLRAHVNCPLCRAPVQVSASAANNDPSAAPGAPTATSGRRQESNLVGAAVGGVQTAEEAARGGGVPDRAVRRAASMVALPRRAWPEPDVTLPAAPASSSGREGDMTGLGKIRRLLKFSDALEMAGIGVERSVSFGAGSCQRLPPRSGPSAAAAAAGVNADETAQ